MANLETKILKTDEEIKSLVAKGSSNPTAKAKALQVALEAWLDMFAGQAMKKKKMYEQQRVRSQDL